MWPCIIIIKICLLITTKIGQKEKIVYKTKTIKIKFSNRSIFTNNIKKVLLRNVRHLLNY